MSHTLVEETIIYLEMTTPDQLRPAHPVPDMTLERVDRDSHLIPLIPAIQARVGAPYGWRSAARSAKEWTVWLSHPLREHWLVKKEGEIAGIANLEPHPGGEAEITTFGLLPEYVGRGLGGHALTLTLRRAWRVEPVGADSICRVWLRTSSFDHPNALPNYQHRGLRPFYIRLKRRNATA